MKQLLTITALLFSVTSFGQTNKKQPIDTLPLIKLDGGKIFDDARSSYQFWHGYSEIAKIKSSGQDTLEISYPALIQNNHLFKYIKVGDKIFEEVKPIRTCWQPTPYYGYGVITPAIGIMPDSFKINHSDTSYLIKKYKKQ